MLADFCEDVLLLVIQELCDPIQPRPIVHLSSIARRIRGLLRPQLLKLQSKHTLMKKLGTLLQMSCVELGQSEAIGLGRVDQEAPKLGYSREPATLTHWKALGTLVHAHGLTLLKTLQVCESLCGDTGVAVLSKVLARRSLKSLTYLELCHSAIGPGGACALAAALARGAMPSVCRLLLSGNQLGDEGLDALAQPLGELTSLQVLSFDSNGIGNRGLITLVVESLFGRKFKKLEALGLNRNRIDDAGCAMLIASMSTGAALPAIGPPQNLKKITSGWRICEGSLAVQPLNLGWNPASLNMRYDVMDAISVRASRGGHDPLTGR